jgi:WD40 repeat protein
MARVGGFDVFVSYRTVDARFGAAAAYDSLADRFGVDRVFLDHASMGPGEPYPASIRAALDQVRVLVVLIGPEWLSTQADTGVRLVDQTGDWVRQEIRRGLERGIGIIPVLLDGTPLPLPAELPDDIRDLVTCQALEVRHRSLRADLNRLANAVARWISTRDDHKYAAGGAAPGGAVPDTTSSAALGSGADRFAGSPYRGLLPFDYAHHGVFYGRERLTDELVDAAADRLDGCGLLMVTGASGVGKSSLVQAGLVPAVTAGRLTAGSHRWPRIVMTPTHHPVDELAARLAALSGVTASSAGDILMKRPGEVAQFIRQVVLTASAPGDSAAEPEPAAASRLLLVVDQFEELFTLIPDTQPDAVAERDAFLTALCAAATTGVGPTNEPALLAVITVRSDFWHHCLAVPELGDLMRDGQFIVRPMTEPELRRAILGPATTAGLQTEPELAELVLADLRAMGSPTGFDAGALPLLSQAMSITWEHRHGDRLTLQAYSATGGVANAVTTSAERVYATLNTEDQATTKTVFHQLATISSSGQTTRRTATRATLHATTPHTAPVRLDAILDAFADERLLVLNNGNVDIAHDSLLTAWQRLQDWLAEDYTDHLIHHQLTDDTTRWQHAHHDKAFLYRGTELTTARKALTRWDTNPDRYPSPTPQARHFIHTSIHADRRTTTVRRTALTALVFLIIATSITALIAITTAKQARHQHAIALSRQLAAQADALTDTNPGLAQRLAAAAWQTAPTSEAHYSMLNALATRQRTVLTHGGDRVVFSPDGTMLATGGEMAPRLWDVNTGKQIGAPFTGHIGMVTSAVFSPDSKTLATSGEDGAVRLWDVTTHHQIGDPLTGHPGIEIGVAFSLDGKTLATTPGDETTRLWDVHTGKQIGAPLTGHTDIVTSAVFSPDSKTLATSGEDQTVRLWDVATHQQIGDPLDGHTYSTSVVFSPDGKTLATINHDQTVRLWDVATHQQIGDPLTGHTDIVTNVVFSPDGKTLATANWGKTVRLWNVATHEQIGDPLTGHTDIVNTAVFSPDGRTLATASKDQTVRLWDVATHQQIGDPLTGHTDIVNTAVFSPDGKTLASASEDDTVRLWDVATHQQIGDPLSRHNGIVNTAVFSPDGKALATASWDKTVRLWNVATHKQIGAPFTGHTDVVTSAVFNPDGKILATASWDKTVRLWNVATHKQIGAPLIRHTGIVTSVAFSPEGKTLATTWSDASVRLWDVHTGKQTGAPLTGHTDVVTNVVFSPDGTILATSDDKTVRLWNVDTGKQVGVPLIGYTHITSVAFDPDGTNLAATSEDKTVRLWNVVTRRQIGAPLTGHTGIVTSVAFSPDGTILASAGEDGTVRLWDVATRRQIGAALSRHIGSVTSVVFSPDGTTLATTGGDVTVQIWNSGFDPHPSSTICRYAGEISPAEWKQHSAGEPQPHVC